MDISLSPRQKQILDLIKESLLDRGYAPSLSEMMLEMGLSTKRSVAFHLEALEKKGYIHRTGEARGINIVNNISKDFMSVPLLGFANAGRPLVLAQEEDLGELTVDRNIVKGKKKVFGVELRGDSMNKRILNGVPMENGNYAIVAREVEVKNGDPVLAIIDDAATVKSYKKQGKTVVLYPESKNPLHKPIYMNSNQNSLIVGKILTVLLNPSKGKKN